METLISKTTSVKEIKMHELNFLIYLMPARRPALDEGPHGDAVPVPVAREIGPEEGHVFDLAALERISSAYFYQIVLSNFIRITRA